MSDMFEICGIENDKIIEAIKERAYQADHSNEHTDDIHNQINIDRRWDIVKDINITSHRKLSGKIIVSLKNKTMKFYKWYVDKLFDQQVEFNHSMWASYYSMKNEIKELREEVEKLKADNGRVKQ